MAETQIDLEHYAWRVRATIDGEERLLVPHADPHVYEFPVNEIFASKAQAELWLVDAGHEDDAYEERWVLVRFTGEIVAEYP